MKALFDKKTFQRNINFNESKVYECPVVTMWLSISLFQQTIRVSLDPLPQEQDQISLDY